MLVFDKNNAFVKKGVEETSGSNLSLCQVFCTSKFVKIDDSEIVPFEFNLPMYILNFGTTTYCGQDPFSVYTNTVLPKFKFIFTANTFSLSAVTMVHDFYKIDNAWFDQYSGDTLMEKLRGAMSIPATSITADTSQMTGNAYYLTPDQYYKNLGQNGYQLFEDRDQYFLDTRFFFEKTNVDNYASDFWILDSNHHISATTYSSTTLASTVTPRSEITWGNYSGLSVVGSYFTYFLMPNKPIWEMPIVQGQLNTFSPTFYFSNVDDGDQYLLQVLYTSASSVSFSSGTIYNYEINKNKTLLTSEEMLNIPDGDWSIAENSTNTIRKYSVPLKTNSDFWYRIGNVKTLNNIFNVQQSVVTFSDVFSGITGPASWMGYVESKSDSPCSEIVPGFVDPGYFDEGLYSLSGTVRGAGNPSGGVPVLIPSGGVPVLIPSGGVPVLITGATLTLYYPNPANYIQIQTDSVGGFMFNDLPAGTYVLQTSYRGYQPNTQSVIISNNTLLDYKINLLWGNNYDKISDLGPFNYFI